MIYNLMIYNIRGQGGGIGTLIIFISIVLVAAIASYVLLGTAGTLQNRALLVGNEATTRVSTKLDIENIYGEANTTTSTPRGIEMLIGVIKISPGSSPIDITSLYLHYADANVLISDIFTNSSLTKSSIVNDSEANFAYKIIHGNDNALIETGESFEIYFYLEDSDGFHHIPENTEFSLTFRPESGQESEIRAKTPSMITKTYTRLYP